MDELALRGGKPVRDKPLPPMYPGAMFIDEDEEESVLEVLRSKSLFRYYGPERCLYKTKKFEDEFAEWLRKFLPMKYRKEVSEITIERHLQVLRSDIARKGIIGYLTSFESERNKRATQRYYKEFLCEHFSHIILPLLQDEEREREIRKEKE